MQWIIQTMWTLGTMWTMQGSAKATNEAAKEAAKEAAGQPDRIFKKFQDVSRQDNSKKDKDFGSPFKNVNTFQDASHISKEFPEFLRLLQIVMTYKLLNIF